MPLMLESSTSTSRGAEITQSASDSDSSSTSSTLTKDTATNTNCDCSDQEKTDIDIEPHENEPPTKIFKVDESHSPNHSHNFHFEGHTENDPVNIADFLKIELEIDPNHKQIEDEEEEGDDSSNSLSSSSATNENQHHGCQGQGQSGHHQGHHQTKDHKNLTFQFKADNVNVIQILKKLESENNIKEIREISTEIKISDSNQSQNQIPYRRRSNLVCPICLEEFTTRRLKQNHLLKVHLVDIHCADLNPNGKSVVGNNCEFCCQKFSRTDTKRRHKRREHYMLWVRCKFEDCKEQYWLGSELLDHLWTVHDARMSKESYYYCIICQKNNFFNAGQLDQHTYQAHKDSINLNYTLPADIPLL